MVLRTALIAGLLFMGVSSHAQAAPYLVKGWHSCMYYRGPDQIWYQPCHIENTYQAPGCDMAFAQLADLNCCKEKGALAEGFHKISCSQVGQ